MLGEASYKEINEQFESWKSVLSLKKQFENKIKEIKLKEYKEILFVGCGSSYYLSQAGSNIFSKLTGQKAKALPASELIFFPETHIDKNSDNLIFFVSRSGKTTEVIKALEIINSLDNVTSIGVTCYEDSLLAQKSDFLFPAKEGKEDSVVMTKSFTSMLINIQIISGIWSNNEEYLNELDKLPDIFNLIRNNIDKKVKDFVNNNDYDKYAFLAQGNLFGIASESMLKIKEMAIVPSEAYHSLEFRHGPKSIADKKMLIVVFVNEISRDSELKLASEIKDYNADVILVGNNIVDKNLNADLIIDLDTNNKDLSLTPLYLLIGQYLGYYTATKKNLDVDNPRNLTQVVESI